MKTLRYRRKRNGDFASIFLFVLSDSLAISCAFIAAYGARFYWFPDFLKPEPPDFIRYLYALPVVAGISLLSFRQKQIYVFDVLRRRLDEIGLIWSGIIWAAVILMALTFLYRDFSYSRIVFLLHCLFSFVFVCMLRDGAYRLDGWIRLLMGTRTRVLILGANRSARQIIHRINRSYRNRYEVVGVLSGGAIPEEHHLEGVPVLGTVDEVIKKIDDSSADDVILTLSDFPQEKLSQLLLKCENELITFLKIPDLFGIFTSGVDIHYIDNVPLIGLKKSPLDKMWNRFLKRVFDVLVSVIAFILLFPAMAVIAALVKIADGGPMLYKQQRTGLDGRSFWIYKFRTMRVDAETKTGPVWAAENDRRTTKIGGVLRRLNLDEIPQLWNVIKGDMSMVGPRPERPHFVGKFRSDVPRYMARHKMKSGITGWAQVNGLRGNTSIAERTKYDLYYYENWSFFLDLKILFMTLFAFKNAY